LSDIERPTVTKRDKDGSISSLTKRLLVLLVAALAAAIGTAAAIAVASSGDKGHHLTPRSAFAVLAHRVGGKAHAAVAATLPGAVPLGGSARYEIYAAEHAPASKGEGLEVCVIDHQIGHGSGSACGPASEVDVRGIVQVVEMPSSSPRWTLAALVPNGVTDFNVVADGVVTDVKVNHNMALYEGNNVSSYNYRLPDGVTESAPMPVPPSGPVGSN
jgi:hypothetical protein